MLHRRTTVSGIPLACYEIKCFHFVLQKGVIFVPLACHWVTVNKKWHTVRCLKPNRSFFPNAFRLCVALQLSPAQFLSEEKMTDWWKRLNHCQQEINLMFSTAPAIKWLASNQQKINSITFQYKITWTHQLLLNLQKLLCF